ncbi:hypothetical protein [Xanthomonas sp. 3075]|uniref:hypothetical protein n=1 Tax=Xanthomonas sp. 3075 TaxID=3035315 RepID=UPI0016148D17|nr:hypothetical protein [Xanthomonas sp. 3075]MBB4133358.1 hypothetical protein [Xanthomonas sp. 3075]
MDEPTMPLFGCAIRKQMFQSGARLIRRGRFEFLRLKSPGQHFSEDAQAGLLQRFAEITNTIYRADTTHYWSTRANYFKSIDDLWTVHLNGEFVGWAGVAWMRGRGRPILYVDTMNMRPRALRSGAGGYTLGEMLVHEFILMCFVRTWLPSPCAFRTQSPVVYRLAQAASRASVFPCVDGTHRSEKRASSVAAEVARRLSPTHEFDLNHSIIKGAYSRSLYATGSPVLKAADPAVASFWQDHLDHDSGDAVVIVVLPTRIEAAKALLRYFGAIWRERFATFARPSLKRRTPEQR